MSKRTDEQLVVDYLEGGEEALTLLVNRYLNSVFNFAFSLVKDKESAEEITQESFVKAWKNIRGFKNRSSFKTWLFTITRNLVIDLLRKKKEVVLSDFDEADGSNVVADNLKDEALLPDQLLMKAEDVRYVRLLLEQIDPKYRDVLELKYEDSLTFAEIGKILKRPLHTVKSQHRRALIALERAFGNWPI